MGPKTFSYEFGGPLGALGITCVLPVVVLILLYWGRVGAVDLTIFQAFFDSSSQRFWTTLRSSPVFCPSCNDVETLVYRCGGGVVAWFLFQVALERFLPAEIVPGVSIQAGAPTSSSPSGPPPPSKQAKEFRLPYRINGHLAFWVTLLFVQVGWPTYDFEHDKWQLGAAPLSVLYEYTPEIALATIVLSFALAAFLYLDSFRGGNRVLAVGGDSGHAAYDFFIGRELNPRVGSFDWKVFCELRPGMIGWVLLNASCWQQQRTVLGHVSGSMVLLNLFQGVYVWDALYQERAILTTMDVTTDGFGFMLVFGDLVWVPFTYSLQARYLVNHDPALGPAALAAILALYLAGYYVFRAANGQKDAFRRDPNDPSLSHLSFLQTKRGTKLLTSGWWGMARKINYLGDWIMGLTWCLVCGFDSLVPYYYAIYFGILLVHRSVRDDHMCQLKYGDDWDTYKKIVPYRFIPGIV
jgi:Delta14-sterol reductase